MKKIILGIVAVFLAGLVAFNAYRPEPESAKPVVKIGVILPLSGTVLAESGKILRSTLNYKAQELSSAEMRYEYRFIVEDGGFDAKRAALITSKFIHQDNVDAIICLSSAMGNVIAPQGEENRVITMTLGASDRNVAKGRYSFIHWTQPETEADKMVEEILRLGYKSAGIISANDAGTGSVARILKGKLDAAGIAVIQDVILPTSTDFRTMLMKMERTKPEIYIPILYPAQFVPLKKQMHDLSIKTPVAAMETFSTMDDRSPAEGLWFVDAAEITGAFKNSIVAHNGSKNVYIVGNMYDSLNLLISAFENADTRDRAVDSLIAVKEHDGVLGRVWQDDIGVFHSRPQIKKIVNGEVVVLEE